MGDKRIRTEHEHTFENIKQRNEDHSEFWFARELAPLLEYPHWHNFSRLIEKAKIACERSGHVAADHFNETIKMVDLGSGAQRAVSDYRLSRYACYLIVQNGDPSKSVIANGQTYFALQTRRQELADEARFGQRSEDTRRLMLRGELTEHNKALTAAARSAGVESGLDYAIFQDHGYKGLYGGLGAKDIHSTKGLKKSQKILDHMGSTELAANLFRATQTEDKLRRDNVRGKRLANETHREVGAKVRQTIVEIGGTMPEKLPTPAKSIRQIEKEQQRLIRDAGSSEPDNA
ncbi:damage-inducible protein D [Ralstonia sp. A12]|uniref:DNA damage-inducible protein D n=1 Tax=Ralstonia sp. A12 TaxID=1217052 RepID=UPI0005758C31|nr:DNA damage-inducible protein D [Ralstonia sp. A12]KHK57134.1 damage-inducible protein D [Ralstonia sp. A12]